VVSKTYSVKTIKPKSFTNYFHTSKELQAEWSGNIATKLIPDFKAALT